MSYKVVKCYNQFLENEYKILSTIDNIMLANMNLQKNILKTNICLRKNIMQILDDGDLLTEEEDLLTEEEDLLTEDEEDSLTEDEEDSLTEEDDDKKCWKNPSTYQSQSRSFLDWVTYPEMVFMFLILLSFIPNTPLINYLF